MYLIIKTYSIQGYYFNGPKGLYNEIVLNLSICTKHDHVTTILKDGRTYIEL